MKTETIENILTFLKEKEGHELPKAWIDLIKKLKSLTKKSDKKNITTTKAYQLLGISNEYYKKHLKEKI